MCVCVCVCGGGGGDDEERSVSGRWPMAKTYPLYRRGRGQWQCGEIGCNQTRRGVVRHVPFASRAYIKESETSPSSKSKSSPPSLFTTTNHHHHHINQQWHAQSKLPASPPVVSKIYYLWLDMNLTTWFQAKRPASNSQPSRRLARRTRRQQLVV